MRPEEIQVGHIYASKGGRTERKVVRIWIETGLLAPLEWLTYHVIKNNAWDAPSFDEGMHLGNFAAWADHEVTP